VVQGNPEAEFRLAQAGMSRNAGTAEAVNGNDAAAITRFETAAKEALRAILTYGGQGNLPDDLPGLVAGVRDMGTEVPPNIEDASGPNVDPARNAAGAAITLGEAIVGNHP
jgi:hypothetical protein